MRKLYAGRQAYPQIRWCLKLYGDSILQGGTLSSANLWNLRLSTEVAALGF